jgi:hypothetical protein
MEEKKQKVLDIVNKMIDLCEPIYYKEFNKTAKTINKDKLRAFEKEEPVVGIAQYEKPDEGISLLSILATVTDIFCGERLAVNMEKNGRIVGVSWYKQTK